MPRATSDEVGFSDEQIDMLVRNTQQIGAGLVMLGGPDSFGAGGWTGTELEKAMPVDFQIRNAEVVPGGALVLVMQVGDDRPGPNSRCARRGAKAATRCSARGPFAASIAMDGKRQWIRADAA